MKLQFSPDFEYLYLQESPNVITAIPTKELTDEEKEFIINQKAKEGYG